MSSRPKPNKCQAIDCDTYVASEPEDAPSQANRQKITYPSSGPKPKKHHGDDSHSDIYGSSEPEDAPSTKKSVQISRSSMKLARSKKQDMPTRRSTRHVRKEPLRVLSTPGEYNLLCDSHGNDNDDDHKDDDHGNNDDDDHKDNDHGNDNDSDHGHDNKFDDSNKNNFDDRNEDDDLDFEHTPLMKMPSQGRALTLKIPSQRSCLSSQMKHIDNEDDWVGQGGLWVGDDSIRFCIFCLLYFHQPTMLSIPYCTSYYI